MGASPRTDHFVVFARWRYLMRGSSCPVDATTETTSLSAHPFLQRFFASSLYFALGGDAPRLPPKNVPSSGGSVPHRIQRGHRSCWLLRTNNRTICGWALPCTLDTSTNWKYDNAPMNIVFFVTQQTPRQSCAIVMAKTFSLAVAEKLQLFKSKCFHFIKSTNSLRKLTVGLLQWNCVVWSKLILLCVPISSSV